MAIRASVTVSIALDSSGMFTQTLRLTRDLVLASEGMTSDSFGCRSTSSKVSPRTANLSGTPAGVMSMGKTSTFTRRERAPTLAVPSPAPESPVHRLAVAHRPARRGVRRASLLTADRLRGRLVDDAEDLQDGRVLRGPLRAGDRGVAAFPGPAAGGAGPRLG